MGSSTGTKKGGATSGSRLPQVGMASTKSGGSSKGGKKGGKKGY